MKRIVAILTLALILLPVACGPGRGDGKTVHTDSFVMQYYPIEDIGMYWKPAGSYLVLYVITDNEAAYGVLSSGEAEKDKYAAKCEKYNDFGYKDSFYYGGSAGPNVPNSYHDRDFSGIEITSDADYDDAHPAGTSLNDLFYFSSSSPIEFIKRGYADPYNWAWDSVKEKVPAYYISYLNAVSGNLKGDPVYGLVSELSPENLILLGGDAWPNSRYVFATLTAVKMPDNDREHNIKVVITDTDGLPLEAVLKIKFY